MEDYSAGRKGPSGLGGLGGGGGGGGGLFGRQQVPQPTASGGLFGAKPLGGGTVTCVVAQTVSSRLDQDPFGLPSNLQPTKYSWMNNF